MGKKCSVEHCTSDSTKPEHTGVTFHKVPTHSDVRPKWLSLCHISEDNTAVKLRFVCSRHFLRADFCSFKGKKYMLKQGVLPSVFPWDKSKLEAIKAEVSTKKEKKKRELKDKKKNIKAEKIAVEPEIKTEKADVGIKEEIKDIKEEPDIKEEHIKTEDGSELLEGNTSIDQNNKSTTSILESYIKNKEDDPEKTDLFDQLQQSRKSSPVHANNTSINFSINSYIEVLDNNNTWCKAKINEVDYEESEILIHFDQFPNKCDEWISMKSPRIREAQHEPLKSKAVYEVGQRCMAVWSDCRKFPATIVKVLEDVPDTYEVLFDDGFKKTLKSYKISKMDLTKPAQSSPLFDPIKSSKQERRDKKRKLNVAALFAKRQRLSTGKSSPLLNQSLEVCSSPGSQDEDVRSPLPYIPPTPEVILEKWYPSWDDNNKPVGIDSTIEGMDGLRKSVVVPDPRLPSGWTKHLAQRMSGNSVGKWDAIILAPDGKKFRTKAEIKNYLDLHPSIEAIPDMFDFSVFRSKKGKKPKATAAAAVEPLNTTNAESLTEELINKEEDQSSHQTRSTKKKRGKPSKTKTSLAPLDSSLTADLPTEEPSAVDQINEENLEEPPVSLKIIFENDAYKCPIDGCGKNFRRENLALMHVKHYHSEYTKYLDSTPNVADLAYARTVGENLDRSPGPPRTSGSKISERTSVTPKILKATASTHNIEPSSENPSTADLKSNNFEIIKLLNQKPVDMGGDITPLPSGLPSNMYPDINLKDLLGKTDDVAMRDDINIKNLCSSRPLQGIKTLLPVRPANQNSDTNEEKSTTKRKRAPSEGIDNFKASTTAAIAPLYESQQLDTHPSPSPSPPQLHLTSDTDTTSSIIPSAFDLAPPPADLDGTQAPTVTQFDGVIIEGGKIIKLERMKQEEIINCTCGFMEEDGLMIQCELCLCWQHAYCNNIQKESEVPEKYVCYICQHPLRERQSTKYLHDQDWLKQGVLPVGSYHINNKSELEKRFEKLQKTHDISGGLLELREYMHTLAVKLKVAEAKNHPKLYLWSKPWEKPILPEKLDVKEETSEHKPKSETDDHEYVKNGLDIDKTDPQNDSMLMMILKSGKETEIPMLNMHNTMEPIIPRPEAAIVPDDCRLNLLDHIAHAESLVEERLDAFEKQLVSLEEGMNLEKDVNYPKTRMTLQLLMRDLDTLKRFSELPMI